MPVEGRRHVTRLSISYTFSVVVVGKNVLNQKTELQKALEKQKDNLAKKELESYIASKTPELEKVIADRAKRLQSSTDKDEDDKVINKELLEVRMKLKPRNDVK
ncbi:unnamed protein product [Callosobruchus maculatus]|uniref:Uncharacterized protein n=1 Tax=Callosobruchus maculatus TaxID=64391 RepID=A0A653D7Q2_CALMS|nr:unnamed protein product [Callosobruchus maculatus]